MHSLTWHKVGEGNVVDFGGRVGEGNVVDFGGRVGEGNVVDFGGFSRCGFYDY